jgi:hypothetical protein
MASYRRGGSSLTCVPYRSSDRTLCTTPQSEPLSGSVESWQGCQGYPAQPDNITIDITFKGGMAGFGSLNGRLTYRRCESSTGSKGSVAVILPQILRAAAMRCLAVTRLCSRRASQNGQERTLMLGDPMDKSHPKSGRD